MLLGCTKHMEDCDDAILSKNNMVKYENQDIGCRLYLESYLYYQKKYFKFGSHCALILCYPMDCDGNLLYNSIEDKAHTEFWKNAKYIGIIGVEN